MLALSALLHEGSGGIDNAIVPSESLPYSSFPSFEDGPAMEAGVSKVCSENKGVQRVYELLTNPHNTTSH